MRTLHWSGDCWCGYRVGGVGDGGVIIEVGVRGGRKKGRVCDDIDLSFLCKIFLLIDLWEEDKGGAEKGLEEVHGNALFEELPELSQHEELQDLELHGGKMV